MESNNKLSKISIVFIIIPTLLYWYWESIASGNIRIDLLLIYPALFTVYVASLWKRYRYYSVLISTLIMVVNIVFFIFSYILFGKYPG
jgi:uncharacterized membrane-anchored protein YitT (DUF2179 family)